MTAPTLRDYYAAVALHGLARTGGMPPAEAARWAADAAEAMLLLRTEEAAPSGEGQAAPRRGAPTLRQGDLTDALYAPPPAEPMLDKATAARLHVKLGLMQIRRQADYAAGILGREVASFTELNEREAAEVYRTALDDSGVDPHEIDEAYERYLAKQTRSTAA